MDQSTELSSRQRFRDFMQATGVPRPLCMPLCSALFPNSWAESAGLCREDAGRWNLNHNLAAARACGYVADKMFYDNGYIFKDGHALGWRSETVGEFEGQPITEGRIDTPLGRLVKRNKRIVDGHAEKDHMIAGEDDLRRAEWLIRARTEAVSEIGQATREVRQFVGDEVVLIYLIAQPFEIGYVGAALEDCILLAHDYPEAYGRCMAATRLQALAYIAAVAEAGVDLIMIDSPGTELFSPAFFERYMLESSIELVGHAHACGLPLTFHTCGRPWTYITRGYYNQILPDILESTSGPPEGDVPDQRQARLALDSRVAVRGSVSLDLLRMGTPERVYDEATRLLDAFRGYKHILAGTCETMGGTPPENMKAMARACQDWRG